MIMWILKIFRGKERIPSTDFSKFFIHSKSSQKKRLIKEIIRKANQDQLQLYKSS